MCDMDPSYWEEVFEDLDWEEDEIEKKGCPCGYMCMDCLGMSWRDFF